MVLGSDHPPSGRDLVRRAGTNALTVELQLHLGLGEDVVTGQITDGQWVTPVLAERLTFHAATNPAPFAGKYTIVIPGHGDGSAGPGGDGYGTVTVTPAGYASLSATLGDGSANVSQRVPISKNGFWPLYVSLYSGKGSLLSWMRFADRPTDDFSGLLSWMKPNLPTHRFYPGGFTNETFALGSRYVPPALRTNRVMNFSNGFVELGGANLASTILNDVLLTPTNRIINLSSNKLSMTITLSSGLFSGSAVRPDTGRPVPFKGVLLQKANYGTGLHSGTNRTGRVSIWQ